MAHSLFEELPEDVNALICGFVFALDLDLGELGRLQRISKAWKHAVEEERLGSAGSLLRPGLLKFACRVADSNRYTYPALGIVDQDKAVFHIHPCLAGRYGKGLEDRDTGEEWVDIPESVVVVNRKLYVLSEPKCQPGWGHYQMVRKMRLRSYDLVAREGGWTERSSLEFSKEEAPLSPTAECYIMGDATGWPEDTSFTVIACKHWIFVYAVSVGFSRSGKEISSLDVKPTHAKLYNTLSNTWSSFHLPASFQKANQQIYSCGFGRKLGMVQCASDGNSIFLKKENGLKAFVHSLQAEALDKPWIKAMLDNELVSFETAGSNLFSHATCKEFTVPGPGFKFTAPAHGKRWIVKFRSSSGDQQGDATGQPECPKIVIPEMNETYWLRPYFFRPDGTYSEECKRSHDILTRICSK